jgi:hypothetical protein
MTAQNLSKRRQTGAFGISESLLKQQIASTGKRNELRISQL